MSFEGGSYAGPIVYSHLLISLKKIIINFGVFLSHAVYY